MLVAVVVVVGVVVRVVVGESVTVDVIVEVGVVVGVVMLQLVKVPSKYESVAWFNISTVWLQLSSLPRKPPILPRSKCHKTQHTLTQQGW